MADEYEIIDEDGNRVAIIRKTQRARRESLRRYIEIMIAGIMVIGLALWALWVAIVR